MTVYVRGMLWEELEKMWKPWNEPTTNRNRATATGTVFIAGRNEGKKEFSSAIK